MKKVVILAGGLGSRLSEYTKEIPKPMVKINGIPIIKRIMLHYSKFGFKEFLIASGYKSKIIENYFSRPIKNWKVRIINTGNKTMTGGRIKRLKKFLYKDTFLLTYGDGLSNVDIKKLYNFHIKQKKMITLTAVRPPARFGAIKLIGNKVKYFKEKSSIDEGWINGGFFVIEPGIFKYLKNDNTFFEKDPLEKAAKNNQLIAYKHKGFWQCMDTKRDKEILETKLRKKKF